MRYIASCSFGKGSIAAIACRMEHGEPIGEAVYCRIMFDDGTSAEYPEHEEWIHARAIPALESMYGIKTTVVQGKLTYLKQFYTRYVRSKEKKGLYYGFPGLKSPWCDDKLKSQPIKTWQKTAGEHAIIAGFTADEVERQSPGAIKGKLLPLVDYGITEAETYEICRRIGLLSPAYREGRNRLRCWFCHNQRLDDLRLLRREYPQLWARLLGLDCDSFRTFKPETAVKDLDNRFANEEAQISLWD